ncbi:hypothetical protein BDW71DRAFT_184176 [Aspergillus fruticulosus]
MSQDDKIKIGPRISRITVFRIWMPLFVPCGCASNTLVSAIPAHDQQIRKMPSIFFSRNRIMLQTKQPAPRLRPVALGNRTTFSGVADGRPKPLAPVMCRISAWVGEKEQTRTA